MNGIRDDAGRAAEPQRPPEPTRATHVFGTRRQAQIDAIFKHLRLQRRSPEPPRKVG